MHRFNQKVWELAKMVPKGKVATYKILAEKLGTKAYRAVGNVLCRNPYPLIVPCHRIVKSDGSVGGFNGSSNTNGKEVNKKIMLLRKDGIKIKENKVVDFDKVIFDL